MKRQASQFVGQSYNRGDFDGRAPASTCGTVRRINLRLALPVGGTRQADIQQDGLKAMNDERKWGGREQLCSSPVTENRSVRPSPRRDDERNAPPVRYRTRKPAEWLSA